MAMPQKCNPLYVPELFDHILGYIAEPYPYYDNALITVLPPEKEGQRALAALAQTCRMFSEPSLNYLWCKLDSLAPLLRTFLPRETVIKGSELRDPLREPEWNVIGRYAHRIQELELRLDYPSVFLLECSVFEPNLLPNLTVLIWPMCDDDPRITLIQPLLSSKLSSLSFYCNTPDHRAISSFLKALPSRCPALTAISLEIGIHPDWESVKYALSRTVCGFENLGRLAVRCEIDGDALRHLVLSPQITQLQLPYIGPRTEQLCSISHSDTPFPNVKEITLNGVDLGCVAALLRPDGQTFAVANFTISFLHKPAPQLTHSFLTALVSRPRCSSLRSVTLSCWSELDWDTQFERGTERGLSHDVLQPLTLLRNLRNLLISTENPIILDDDELASLARGWPLLEELRLNFMDAASEKHVTFKGLLSLCTACPKLKEALLSLDGTEVPDEKVMDVCSETLVAIYFQRSPIHDPLFVAAFLAAYFPNVTSVEPGSYGQPPYHDRWVQVQKYLDVKTRLLGLAALKS